MRKSLSLGLLVLLLLLPLAAMAQEPTSEPVQEPTVSAETDPPVDQPIRHIIEEGESLYYIADLYGTTVAALLYLNNLTEESLLFIGQELIVSGDVPEATPVPDSAEIDPTIPKIHSVAQGETLLSIAEQYGIALDELINVNRLAADAVLSVGQELLIPGVAGSTIVVAYPVTLGDTLASIATRFDTTRAAIIADNAMINPDHLIINQPLRITSRTGSEQPHPLIGATHFVSEGETPLLVAANYGISPATLTILNDESDLAFLQPDTRLMVTGSEPYRALPGLWTELAMNVQPVQGRAFAVRADTVGEGEIFGRIHNAGDFEQTIRFMPMDGTQAAIVGLDAFAEPGLYTLELDDGNGNRIEQAVFVPSGDYGAQQIAVEEEKSELLDFDLRFAEDAYLAEFYNQYTPEKRWDGIFAPPVVQSTVSADYGAARSYNDGPYLIFHTGTDYALPQGTPVLAPAPGTVVFNEMTSVHGRHVIVDHGMGVMTSYSHLDQTAVNVGDELATGQLIGAIGTTGLSNGYHLHWEVRVLNTAVDAVQWLEVAFP
jgi:murein DD-endopeptidase MepM/ murein hydrolase activator NlpD